MKQVLLTFALFLLPFLSFSQTFPKRPDSEISRRPPLRHFYYSLVFGCGISLNTPAAVPFLGQIKTVYPLTPHFSVGAGTGISAYEKILLPLFGSLRLNLLLHHRLVPYFACNLGYSLPLSAHTNGGFYLSPDIGIEFAISYKFRLSFSTGYEFQKLERLKTDQDIYFTKVFQEQLRHHIFTLKTGLCF